jgi:hypothetical protein
VVGCTLHLKEFESFRLSLEQPLLKAFKALEPTDKDLCDALGKIFQQVTELTDTTVSVVQTNRTLAKRVLCEVLPQSKLAARNGMEGAQASHIRVQQMLITKMKNDAKVVRASYLGVMEALHYLVTCTQTSLDFYDCNEDLDINEPCWVPNALEYALRELNEVMAILLDPTDFWLAVHMTELELGRLENATQHFSMLHPGSRSQKSQLYTYICTALEKLLVQYLIPCEQGEP